MFISMCKSYKNKRYFIYLLLCYNGHRHTHVRTRVWATKNVRKCSNNYYDRQVLSLYVHPII